MKLNAFQKVMGINRSIWYAMLIALGSELILAVLLTLLLIREGSFFASLAFILPSMVLAINFWLHILFGVAVYSSGYRSAVTMGMTRKGYLRGAYLFNLSYSGLTAALILVCFLLSLLFPHPAQAGDSTVTTSLNLLLLQIALFALFTALSMLFGSMLMRFGVKAVTVICLLFTVTCIAFQRLADFLDTIVSIRQTSLVLPIAAGCVAVIGALTFWGYRVLKTQQIN